MSMTRLETFVNLGYKRDPFFGAAFKTGDMVRVERILTMAVESRAMVSIVGERGIGKSDSVNAAIKKLAVKLVKVQRLDTEGMTIGDIRAALITDLSAEATKRGGETSSRQVRRIVGEASITKKMRVVLLIEEAQRLHPNTLRSLKTLREIEYLGERELFTIILVAQSDPMNRAGVSEVRLRSDCVRMQGLSADEAAGYIKATIGKHFDDASMDALADLPAARNYLELQALAVELLNHALASGREQVTVEDVSAVAGSLQAAPLPKGNGRGKASAAPVTGTSALAAVLGKRTSTPLSTSGEGPALSVANGGAPC